MKITLIDDDTVWSFALEHMLKHVIPNLEFQSFSDPEKAVEALRDDFGARQEPDVLFIDINMPFLDGWQVLDELREEIEGSSTTKTYIMSSSVNPVDEEKAEIEAGIKGYLIKPMSKESLAKLLT